MHDLESVVMKVINLCYCIGVLIQRGEIQGVGLQVKSQEEAQKFS